MRPSPSGWNTQTTSSTRRSRVGMALAFGVAASILTIVSGPAVADHPTVTVPVGFTATRVASGFNSPTALAQSDDGRLFISLQNGQVRIVEDDTIVAAPWGTIPVETGATQGLFGIAFDPAFDINGHLYAFHTVDVAGTLRARVSQFTSSGNTRTGGATTIWQSPPLRANTAVSHYGGDIQIGFDEKLYFTFGDDLFISRPQDLGSLFGKMLRLNLDGSIPTDNPFYATTTGENRAIYARGLRNPFKFTVDPLSGRMIVGDVGRDTTEELNEIVAGGNYGWVTYEGSSGGAAGFVDPIFEYPHSSPGGLEGCSTAAGSFYNPPTSQFPAEYGGAFFALDFCANWVKSIDFATGSVNDFAEIESPVDSVVAPDGSLYILSRDSNDGGATSGGSLWKIEYNEIGAPQITAQPESAVAVAGEIVSFSVTATGTAPLAYQWQRDGVDIDGATGPRYDFTPSLADDGAAFRVLVSNSIASVLSNNAQLEVNAGGGVPAISFTQPAPDFTWGGGDTVNFAATVTDPEDGVLQPTAFVWSVRLGHDEHFHPFIPPTPGVDSGSFVVPLDGEADPDVLFRIRLDAEDSDGNVTSEEFDVFPRLSTLTLATSPPGLTVTIDGEAKQDGAQVVGVEGLARELSVLSPQTSAGTDYVWSSWSNAQGLTHTISFPVDDDTITANFDIGAGSGVAPSITTEPADASVLSSDTATFSVIAEGDEPLSYQWQREGIDVPGATESTYTTPPTSAADDFAGYRVLITNGVGTIASRTAILRVADGTPRIADGLTGLWDFSEGSGNTVADSSGYETPLPLTIANPSNVSWIDGGLAISAPTSVASGGPATKLIAAAVASGEATVEAWITPSQTAPGAAGRIAGIFGQSTRNLGISQGWWSTDPTTNYASRVRTTGNYNNSNQTPAGSTSQQLTHVAATVEAGGPTDIYVDGVLLASAPTSGTFVWHNDIPFVVGNEPNGKYPFIGDVHLVAMYDRALDAAEVVQNFDAGVGGPQTLDTPTITAQPIDRTVATGQTVDFSVEATSTAPLTYQWRRDLTPIDGATSNTLTLSGVQLADSGATFDVVVTNSAGPVVSDSALLTVTDSSSRVSDGLTGLWTFQEGSGASVGDSSGAGEPLDLTIAHPANVSWIPGGGISITTGTRIASSEPATKLIDASVASGEISVEAWITPAGVSPAAAGRIAGITGGTSETKRNVGISQGWWSANATNVYEGRLRTANNYNNPIQSAAVTTERTHVVLTRSAGGQIAMYTNGVRSSITSSSGALAWHDDIPFIIGNELNGKYPFLGEVHLVATYSTALSPAEVAQNYDAGSSPTTSPVPTIEIQPMSVTVTSGLTATFSVGASGSGPLTFQWRRNGAPIPGETNDTLEIPNVQPAEDGDLFDVIVTDSLGSLRSDDALLTVSAPSVTVVGNPTVTVVSGDSVLEVSWTQVVGASKYQLRYRPTGQARHWDEPTTALTRTITGIPNGLEIIVEVRALTGSTWGAWTTVPVTLG